VLTVFGCGGDRDRGKRPIMGELAARLSDLAFATSDNPRTEKPKAILDDVLSGVGASLKTRVRRVEDRRTAIAYALKSARPGDCVLIAGKGHEDYQVVGTEKAHFDDREEARAVLKDLGWGKPRKGKG
jgi:UDP-N-acetylmuramoyl-L-alanyl-D-glutamate--2,6-diaminopimelate ligase